MGRATTALITGIMLVCTACAHRSEVFSGSGAGGNAAAVQKTDTFVKPVSFSILQDYRKGEDLREVARDFELMKELGLTTWRGSFAWGDLEPALAKYDLDWLHRFADLAARHGIKLRPYLAYTPVWAAKGGKDKEAWNDPPARLKDWTDFVSAVTIAMSRHKNILSYEVYNEENVPEWWDGTAAEYNAVLSGAAGVIRKTAPGKEIVFGGMVYPDAAWVRKACLDYGNSRNFDILPFHAYPETWSRPEIVLENYLDQANSGFFEGTFIPWADTYCGRKPVWINEAGYANTPGRTEADQANWWARAFATFLADPRVEHLGIYQIKERVKGSEVIGGSENYYLGITRPDRTRKLAFFTIQRLVTLLNVGKLTVADNELQVEVTSGRKQELYRHLFVRPDGRQVLLVWDKKGNPTLRIRTRPGSAAIEYGLDGKPRAYPYFDGQLLENVKLTPGTMRIFLVKP